MRPFTPMPSELGGELGSTWLDRRRDAVAWWLSNWILNHIATEAYRARIHGLILIGVNAVLQPPPVALRTDGRE